MEFMRNGSFFTTWGFSLWQLLKMCVCVSNECFGMRSLGLPSSSFFFIIVFFVFSAIIWFLVGTLLLWKRILIYKFIWFEWPQANIWRYVPQWTCACGFCKRHREKKKTSCLLNISNHKFDNFIFMYIKNTSLNLVSDYLTEFQFT